LRNEVRVLARHDLPEDLDRLRLRGLCGAADEFTLAAIAQNLRRMTKLISRGPPLDGIAAPA
jgi:hypothetical protein